MAGAARETYRPVHTQRPVVLVHTSTTNELRSCNAFPDCTLSFRTKLVAVSPFSERTAI
jgi:hypothetical protein